jgi:hypothetical protein
VPESTYPAAAQAAVGHGHPYEGKHTYAEALYFVLTTDQLSEDDKRAILGGTAQRLLGWPPQSNG